jgi:hypothetical protein
MKYLISVVFILILNSVSFCQNILIVEEPLISEMMSTRKDLNFRKKNLNQPILNSKLIGLMNSQITGYLLELILLNLKLPWHFTNS